MGPRVPPRSVSFATLQQEVQELLAHPNNVENIKALYSELRNLATNPNLSTNQKGLVIDLEQQISNFGLNLALMGPLKEALKFNPNDEAARNQLISLQSQQQVLKTQMQGALQQLTQS